MLLVLAVIAVAVVAGYSDSCAKIQFNRENCLRGFSGKRPKEIRYEVKLSLLSIEPGGVNLQN